MSDDATLCPGCFLEPSSEGSCARCGYYDNPGAFPTALRPGTVLSRYTVGRVLGKPGGFGITYLGFDPVLKRRVAIKELMPRELVARRPDGQTLQVHTKDEEDLFKYTLTSFLNEARLIAQFSHPNVVRVLDFFEANGTAYFVMDYYEGQTLAEYARKKGGRLAGDEAVALILPLLDALEHIHTLPERILHRDIKPANIYLTGRQVPILLDFGAARVAMGQSRSLSAVLTPGYAPYEQYSTRGNQGPWSDVYGVAATLYFVLTGRTPPEANDRLEHPEFDSPRALSPDVPLQISDAIVAGLGFKPAERPQSARAFADLLQGRAPVPAVPPPLPAGANAIDYAPTLALPATAAGANVRTQIATATMPGGRTERASESWPSTPPPPVPSAPLPSAPATSSRRSASRMPLIAGAAAVVLVVGLLAVPRMFDSSKSGDETGGGSGSGGQAIVDPPPDEREPKLPEDRTIVAKPQDVPAGGAPAPTPPTPETITKPSVPTVTVAEKKEVETPPPPPPPPPPPGNGVLVLVYGNQADGARQAETAILRSLINRSGLQAVDANSLSMMRGDRSAVQAAGDGDFSALARLGRQHGVELMVVGDLQSNAAPSINRFYTGTAELSVKMYRVSNSTLVDTQTFSTGEGGAQPQLAISEGEARSKAATAVANAAAAGVGSWLSRAGF